MQYAEDVITTFETRADSRKRKWSDMWLASKRHNSKLNQMQAAYSQDMPSFDCISNDGTGINKVHG